MTTITQTIEEKKTKAQKGKVPTHLIYEIWDGKPIYYKGYKKVLNKPENHERVMGCSSLQSEIISYLLEFFYINIVEN